MMVITSMEKIWKGKERSECVWKSWNLNGCHGNFTDKMLFESRWQVEALGPSGGKKNRKKRGSEVGICKEELQGGQHGKGVGTESCRKWSQRGNRGCSCRILEAIVKTPESGMQSYKGFEQRSAMIQLLSWLILVTRLRTDWKGQGQKQEDQ